VATSANSSWRHGGIEPKLKSGGSTKASGEDGPEVGHFVLRSRDEALIEVFDVWR
jgi:hypothetical protein